MNYYLHGVDQTFCFHLNLGRHTLGRGAGSDIAVNDPSVSTQHAELEVKEEGIVLIRDLDSTNGTFVASEKITKVTIALGQEVTFGNVRFKFDDQPTSVIVPRIEVEKQPEATWMPDGEPACLLHPGIYAIHQCSECGHALCNDCVRQVGLKGNRPTFFCANCSGSCISINGPRRRVKKRSRLRRIVQSVERFFRD